MADEPVLDFEGTTPYEDYVRASVLHSLQHPVSDDPREISFLMITQIMELYFGLIVHELRQAQVTLRADDVRSATVVLQRCDLHFRALNGAWLPLARMTPREFNSFRPVLGEGSGFQSGAYRLMEFLLGEKSESMLVPHRGVPSLHAELTRALHEPSVYDDVLALLARRGLSVPKTLLDRDLAQPYQPSHEVEDAWAEIYSAPPGELSDLGEALTDVAEQFSRWRYDHLLATRRAMGAKTGTGGSAGVAWLEKRVRRDIFPELWSARSQV